MVFDTQNEDLFEETKMSFGEHLEELRVVLIRAVIGLVIGFLIALLIAGKVVSFLQTPLKEAIQDFMVARAKEDLMKENGGFIPPELSPELNKSRLTPKRVKIDPETMLTMLSPYLGEDAVIETGLNDSFAFRTTQIKQGQAIPLAEILSATDPDDAPANLSLVTSHLSEEDKQSLAELAKKEEATAEDRDRIAAILSELTEKPSLYEDPNAKTALKQGIKKKSLLSWLDNQVDEGKERQEAFDQLIANAKASGKPEDIRRINNWIVSLVLPEYINEPVINLNEIEIWETTEINPQALNAHEVFMIYLKAAMITGLIIASPWIFFQIWGFVAAGLYPHERRYVYIYLPFSIFLFLGGALLAFFFVFKPVLTFLFSFNAAMGIDPQPRIGEWLSFVMFMPIGFGVAFQLPLVMLFLNRIGLVTLQLYLDKWRIAVMVIFFLSMMLTPADPISMILLAGPLTLLYFLGIGLCKWMPKGRNPFTEAYEPT